MDIYSLVAVHVRTKFSSVKTSSLHEDLYYSSHGGHRILARLLCIFTAITR